VSRLGEQMLCRVLALLALPLAGLLAQAPVEVRISAANDAVFVIRMPGDSTYPRSMTPLMARGTAQLTARVPVTITARDSVSRIHVEASENGRLIASAEGPYVTVLRDSTGSVLLQARATFPPPPASRRP
jgi:hypothetical protein